MYLGHLVPNKLKIVLTKHDILPFCFALVIILNVRYLLQKAYTVIHPRGELPVKFNDVLFSLHAVSMNIILIVQCLVYERADQKVSVPMMTLVGGLWLTIACGLSAAITEKMAWLQYLYYLSYIKVGTTPIKYTPQVRNNNCLVIQSNQQFCIVSTVLGFYSTLPHYLCVQYSRCICTILKRAQKDGQSTQYCWMPVEG